jgi:hypothetical protein
MRPPEVPVAKRAEKEHSPTHRDASQYDDPGGAFGCRAGHTQSRALEDAVVIVSRVSACMPMPLFPFRYRDCTGNWVGACYLAERHEIAERYAEWELVGQPGLSGAARRFVPPWRTR